jgi:membrane associated rhomboid family serine protease
MPSQQALEAQHEAIAARRFVVALVSRSSPFTMILIGANAAMFLVEWLAGGMGVMSADHSILLALGAKQNDLIANAHEYWRLVTCIFLHIGFAHVLLNNYALWIIGQEIERLYGSARFVLLYTLTGIIASLSSFYFSPQATSAGASGAIFGLFGVMAAFAFRYRREIPNAIGKSIRSRVVTIIALNLFIGFQSGIVDNSAHIGGLLSGAALALLVPYKRPEESNTPFVWRAMQTICLAIMLVSLGFAFHNFRGSPLSISNLTATPGARLQRFESYFTSIDHGFKAFVRGSALMEQPDEKSAETAKRVFEAGMSEMTKAPNIGVEAESYRTSLLDLLRRKEQLSNKLLSANTVERSAILAADEALDREFRDLRGAFDRWAPSFLKSQGYSASESDNQADTPRGPDR